jgi:hypothetical protein
MKKGKTTKLNILPKAKSFFGTVDSKELKSVYIVIQCWIEPNDEYDNWDRIIGNLERQIKHNVLEQIDLSIFQKYNIVDLDLRSSGIKLGKRSFVNLEITFFIKEEINFKSFILKDRIRRIVVNIYRKNLLGSKYFTIHKTKSTTLLT